MIMQNNHHARTADRQGPNIRALRDVDDPFDGATVDVARRLIGATLQRVLPPGEPDGGTIVRGRIVEVEAYLPNVDPSCHGYRGPTKRNAWIFGRRGTAYVYLIYGMHFCLNVVTEPAGIGAAVLVRAVEPLEGVAAMRRRRLPGTPEHALASGPGNLCRAMSIDLRCNGQDLREGDLSIAFPHEPRNARVAVATRIGLSSAERWPLRFYDPYSDSVSKRPTTPRTLTPSKTCAIV
jgi:DNA-3-methyladenine glycosylase